MPPRSPAHSAFGEAVRKRRQALGLSQDALAELAGVHRNYLGEVERGERNIALANILALAGALGAPAGDLVGAAEAAGLEAEH